jgi:hypothetical protein
MRSSVPGDRFVAAGIVANPVAAVRVGEIPAALRGPAAATRAVAPLAGYVRPLPIGSSVQNDTARDRRPVARWNIPLSLAECSGTI